MAPIQRLADAVAGRFTYGVMGISAATFLFWRTAGLRLFPQVLHMDISGSIAAACWRCVEAAFKFGCAAAPCSRSGSLHGSNQPCHPCPGHPW